MTTDCEKIKADVDTYLAEIGVSFGAQLIGETVRENNWKADEFRIIIRRKLKDSGQDTEFTTSYYMGTGNRKPIKGAPADKGTKNTLFREDWEKRYLRPVAPKAADVLASLIMEAQAIDQSFEDWASEYGYDFDSRKAFGTYEACCEIGHKMRKMFSTAEREKLAELTQDL